MSDWPRVKLADLLEDGRLSYGIVQPGFDVPGGVPIVRVTDLDDGRIATKNALHVDPAISARHARTVLRGGELLVSIVGTIGETALVPAELSGWNVARAIAVIRPQDVSAAWIRRCMQTDAARASLDAGLNTTVQSTLNLSELKQLSVPMPPTGTRASIVELLDALDDKIAVNDRIRALVDGLCRVYFQRLATTYGRVELSEIAIVNAVLTKPRVGRTLRYIEISSVGQGSYELPRESSWDEAPGRARRVVRHGDTIWSTVRPNRRSHALVLDFDSSLIASTGLAVLTPRDRRIAGLYEATRTNGFVEYLESVAEGSAYPAVRADRFDRAPIPALRSDEWGAFESFALPLRQRAHAAEVESRRLAAIRDELLPLLMSGRVRVRDAEKVVGDLV